MTIPRQAVLAGGVGIAAIVLVGLLVTSFSRRTPQRPAAPAQAGTAAPSQPTDERQIKARLFYVSEDGRKLTSMERDVRYAEHPVDQARALVEAQLAPVAEPIVSAVPAGTKLRALFLTKEGEAFVDLSGEVSASHGGGVLDELLTVYTIVHALTANMPAITAVQVLVDGKEVDTLAGHVDLRRPLLKNPAWLQ
jgi:spore germination protein GerM